MSIETELQRIIGAKSNIRSAIITKGVDVPENVKIEQLADYILDIGSIKENIGGKLYKVVEINGKTWMAENLDYVFDGLTIDGPDADSRFSRTNPLACYYNDGNEPYKPHYGLLYNWPAVNYLQTNRQTLIPGWHVPSKAEFTSLFSFAGAIPAQEDGNPSHPEYYAGAQLKAKTDWPEPTDEREICYDTFGFCGLPAGLCDYDGTFEDVGTECYFWTSTKSTSNTNQAWRTGFYHTSRETHSWQEWEVACRFSIRLVKDST